jgi:pilus assembly protein Flp/PilA
LYCDPLLSKKLSDKSGRPEGTIIPAKAVVFSQWASYNESDLRKTRFCGEMPKKGEDAMLFSASERGQGLVEYALILVLVAIVVFAALMILGPVIGNTFSTINNSLQNL